MECKKLFHLNASNAADCVLSKEFGANYFSSKPIIEAYFFINYYYLEKSEKVKP